MIIDHRILFEAENFFLRILTLAQEEEFQRILDNPKSADQVLKPFYHHLGYFISSYSLMFSEKF